MKQKITVLFFLGFCMFTAALPPGWAKSSSVPAKQNKLQKFPDFPSKGKWGNNKKLPKKFFKNNVTLVYFWDYTSINCLRELKPIQQWQETYKPYGFQILWVHAPEFSVAANAKNVKAFFEEAKLEGPLFMDDQFILWEKLNLKSWPTKILVNEKKEIIFTQIGEGRFALLEEKIRKELKHLDPVSVLPPKYFEQDRDLYDPSQCGPMSGETYLGYKRANWWGARISNQEMTKENETTLFRDRGERTEKGFFAQGAWINRSDFLEHARETSVLTDYLGLLYQGREVYVVAHQPDRTEVRVYVTRDERPIPADFRGTDLKIDEKGDTYFVIKEPRLYHLISAEDQNIHELKLWSKEKGTALHSFSFSNLCLAEFNRYQDLSQANLLEIHP